LRLDTSFLKDLLEEFSLVIIKNGGIIFSSKNKSIRPILDAYIQLGDELNMAIIADRIIGKAAALIICNTRPMLVYTLVMSKPALEVFKAHGVRYQYEELVENILDKDGNICMFERLLATVSSPSLAVSLIKKKFGISNGDE